jgi:hypothetical protein
LKEVFYQKSMAVLWMMFGPNTKLAAVLMAGAVTKTRF